MLITDVLVGVVILIGLVGIALPVMPGTLLIFAAVLVWALRASSAIGWGAFALVTVVLVVGGVVKYVVPGRRLRIRGIPHRTLLIGGLVGVVGFFVVPVVGLVLGFVFGVYISELSRVGRELAWPATKAAVQAVGLSLLIELSAGLVAALGWLVAAMLA